MFKQFNILDLPNEKKNKLGDKAIKGEINPLDFIFEDSNDAENNAVFNHFKYMGSNT